MAEVVVSSAVELLLSTVKQQIQYEIELVRGVDKELYDLSDKLDEVKKKLNDAEMKQFKDETVKRWLRKLEKKSQEMEDVLEEWSYAIIQHSKMEAGSGSASSSKKKVCSFIPSPSLCFKKVVFRHDIAKKVQTLKSELDGILNEKAVHDLVVSQPRSDHSHAASWRVQSTSLIDSEAIKGRKDEMESLVKKLTAPEGLDFQVLSIVGVGGLGKTTLAQQVYNDSRVQQCFDSKIWICVSDPFEVKVIAKGIIEAINGKIPEETTQLDVLLQTLKSCVSGKKFLLVLDDVWNEESDKWDGLRIALKHGREGSKILVTSRKEHVARIMGSAEEDIHPPKLLSDEDCLSLLMRTSGRSKDKSVKFRKIGEKIAKKCNGLPLAAKTLGRVLLLKKTVQEWEKLLKSEMWDLKCVEIELFPHLLLSYNELSPMHKRCFSFCAFFPKDKKLKMEELIRIWTALGYLGSDIGSARCKGREAFEDLAMRSLFQNFEEDESTKQIISCKMHDIVHDFAQFLRKNGGVEDPRMTKGTCQVCDPYSVSNIQEYRSLFWIKHSPLYICDCITNLRMLKYTWEDRSPMKMEKLIHLKWLDISHTKPSKEDLQTICKLYFLQTLFFTGCSIKEVPEEIENLVHLRYLDLSANRELKELPESICRLVELQTLLLSGCCLKKIPTEIGNIVQLRLLNLSWNKELEELPESICRLVELQTLLLSSCCLKKIPREIGNIVQLRLLDLSWNTKLEELPESICRLVELQTLLLSSCCLKNIPTEIGNIVQLRLLDLRWNKGLEELPESICRLVELQTLMLSNCCLKKIPREIGNIVQLRLLDFSWNKELEVLPESICRLVELQTLLLSSCSLKKIPREIENLVHLERLSLNRNKELEELPECIGSLVKLQILDVKGCKNLHALPKELGQLSGLQSLQGFHVGSGCNKFGLLRNLNSLSKLSIMIDSGGCSSIDMKELVEDAREAELRDKVHLTEVAFEFIKGKDEEDRSSSSSSSLWVDVMEALEPYRNLKTLYIRDYEGSRLPHWISSPLNLVRSITLIDCLELSSLPAMGKLPVLENLWIFGMKQLKVLGAEWLGITGREGEMMDIPPSSSSSSLVLFPKLELLEFVDCPEWLQWEDITAEQEESTVVSVMPRLRTLHIRNCDGLRMLPHRLLRKASSLRHLNIRRSSKLVECYGDRDGSPSRSISQNNPQLEIDLHTSE